MGILDYKKISRVTTEEFEVGSINSNVYMDFYTSNPDIFDKIDDTLSYIDYAHKIKDTQFNSILIAGLGLGTLPQYIAISSSCEVIDIIEKNPNIISTMSNFGIYDSKLNIIEGDIFTYTPVQGYDIILFDIWWTRHIDSLFDSTIETLRTKYNPYLNENGFLYFPILGVNGGQDTFPKI